MQNSDLYNSGFNCYNFGLVMFVVLHSRKLKLCSRCMFSVVSILINWVSVTSTSSIMHVMANHYVTVDGTYPL